MGSILLQKSFESRSSQIICLNLTEFEQVIVQDYLWNSLDRINGSGFYK
jgi:hypothetical protein